MSTGTSGNTHVLETERLRVRPLRAADAGFILALVNDPDWLRNIGDRNVRSRADARRYILDGPVAMYRRHGFGLWAVELKAGGEPIGLCGLLKREWLDAPDLGFALLPGFRGCGHAWEAARAVMGFARCVLGIRQVLAIVTSGNRSSVRLLRKLGFRFACSMRAPETGQLLDLYASDPARHSRVSSL